MNLSIIIPAYNEEANIEYIYNEIIQSFNGYDFLYEIIIVDDGSKDNTFEIIRKLNSHDTRLKGIRLSRNFGQQAAIMAGFGEAKYDLIVTMDCDGQHPPSIIHELITEHKKGYDIVNTRRVSMADANWFKRISARLFIWLLNYLSDIDMGFEYSDFRLMNRKAIDAFLQLDEQNRFMRGLVSWIGFKQSSVSYEAPKRYAGITKWTFNSLFRLGMNGITSFSSKPLRLSIYAGVAALVFGFFYSIYILIVYMTGNAIPGWPSLLITILLLGGFQLVSLGIIGEYIARIFHESKRRPHFFVQDVVR